MVDKNYKSFVERVELLHKTVDEGINDKGIFKAVFIAGIPGAGKSYTAKRIAGGVMPVIINTDRVVEWKAKKMGVQANSANWKEMFRDSAKRVNAEAVFQAVNGMLPLFIDTTSNNPALAYLRQGTLEKIGYDTAMVFIDTDFNVALKRVKDRNEKIDRAVSLDFVERAAKSNVENKRKLKSSFDDFFEFDNSDPDMDNEMLMKLYRQVQRFFSSPVENPIGVKHIETLKENGGKNLIPSIYDEAELHTLLDGWYE